MSDREIHITPLPCWGKSDFRVKINDVGLVLVEDALTLIEAPWIQQGRVQSFGHTVTMHVITPDIIAWATELRDNLRALTTI